MIHTAYLQQREGETIPELAKRIAAAHDTMRKPQPEIISRAEAKAQGLKYYFTGKPCKRGLVAIRLVSSSHCQCRACKEDKRVADANRRKVDPTNRERDKEKQKKYRDKKRDIINAKRRERYKENPQHYRNLRIQYSSRNRDVLLQRQRENRAKNPDRQKEYRVKYREKHNTLVAKRRAEQRQAIPTWFSEFDEFAFQQAYELAAERKQETGIIWHVDHMIPLRARKCCGLHCADNIQVIPAVMNLDKNNKMQLTKPLEWLR